jgi:hypothetical protein
MAANIGARTGGGGNAPPVAKPKAAVIEAGVYQHDPMAYTQGELDLYVCYLRLNYSEEHAAFLMAQERRRRLA